MKKILAAIQNALQKLESLQERRQALEAEQRGLPENIRALTTAVGGGQTKKIDDLQIAKARQELIPDELVAMKHEYTNFIGELRSLVSELNPTLAKIHGEASARIEKVVREFLAVHLDNTYQVNEITRQIITNSKVLAELYKFKVVYEGAYSFNQNDPQLVISRAEYALKNLQNYQ